MLVSFLLTWLKGWTVQLSFSSVLSVSSFIVSVTVAWLTLFRRGTLRMTQPVQIAFLFEGEKPKIFLRTLLYATGKRGYVIEGLFLKVRQQDETQTFAFWAYGERNALMVAGGLRVTEEGVAHNHHFLQINEDGYFPHGNYEISMYARIVNHKTPKLLGTAKVSLSDAEATNLHVRRAGVLFTWNPDTSTYDLSGAPQSREGETQL
jgi:hypothetical protein